MIHREARVLRDLILAEAASRGVHLEEYLLRIEVGLPVLHLRIGAKPLRGCRVRLPGAPGSAEPDVITVHGSGHRASRMWPRRMDGAFNISAVTERLLALVEQELSHDATPLELPTGVSAAASGLHVVQLAAVRLGVLTNDVTPEAIVARVADPHIRRRIEDRLVHGGLTDGDMRSLGDAAALFVGREMRIDHDPLEPINNRILRILRVGERVGREVERRYVLILDRRGGMIDVADPGGRGLAEIPAARLRVGWKLGATGKPWVATISAR